MFRRFSRILKNNDIISYNLVHVSKTFEKLAPINLNARINELGLIVPPSIPKQVSTVFLTNHLNLSTLEEALASQANLIYSYHPPLTQALESLKPKNWFITNFFLGHKVAVFSSHISMQANLVANINSWLINSFDLKSLGPIKTFDNGSFKINVDYSKGEDLDFIVGLKQVKVLHKQETNAKIQVPSSELSQIMKLLNKKELKYKVECNDNYEAGKIGHFKEPLSIAQAAKIIKQKLQLDGIYIAFGKGQTIDSHICSVAVCAGSGSSVLKNADAQLYVTGEMNRDELNDTINKRISIMLCRQTINQNGLLNHLATTLSQELPGLKIVIAKEDAEHFNFEWH